MLTTSSLLDQSKPASFAQQGYAIIRRAIRDGKIQRGHFFSETTLAESLGVSRTPVREALLNLFRDGVVEIVPKRGYKLVELDSDDIVEVRLLRVALEQFVVDRLCDVATADDIAALRDILAVHHNGQADMYSIDERFHVRMAEIAKFKHITRELLSVRGKMYLISSGARLPQGRDQEVEHEHLELLEALEKRDRVKARRLIKEHVEHSIDACVAARKNLGSPQLERIA